MSDTHPRYIVSYWIESASPYLVVDTKPETDGTCVVVGAFTASMADTVAEALNEAPKVERLEAELRRQALLHEQARKDWAEQQDYSDAALRAKADGYARYGGTTTEGE